MKSKSEHVRYISVGNDITYGVQRDPDGWTVTFAREAGRVSNVATYPLDVDTNEIREASRIWVHRAEALNYAVQAIEQDREERKGDLETRRNRVLEEAGFHQTSYKYVSTALQNMVDHVIELEDRK